MFEFELTPDKIAMGLTSYVIFLFSVSIHESAHGWMALQLGDDTALREERISLNPLVHIDPIGTVLIPLLQFLGPGIPLMGWAKPTPVGAHNFRRLARGHLLVAGAGPVSNLILAVLFTSALFVAVQAGLVVLSNEQEFRTNQIAYGLAVAVAMNVSLAIFNLVPLPPLDGSWIASWGLPRNIANEYDRVMEPYGRFILLILFVTGILGYITRPFIHFVEGLLYRAFF